METSGQLIYVKNSGKTEIILQNKSFAFLNHKKRFLLQNSYYRNGDLIVTYMPGTIKKTTPKKIIYTNKLDDYLRNN